MGDQTFTFPLEQIIFLNFINEIGYKQRNTIIIYDELYKKGCVEGTIEAYIDIFRKYYRKSKQKYLDKCDTYKGFITVIRQCCRHLGIYFEKKVKYMHGTYNIQYIIYLPKEDISDNCV